MENASYCIKNEQYEKEEYLKKKAEILKDKKSFQTIWEHIQRNIVMNFASESVS
jgi:hypothetical protein